MGASWSTNDIPDLSSTRILVTGANAGLGFASCVWFAKKGAEIIMTARNMVKGESAMARIKEIVPNANLTLFQLDQASFASVRAFAAAFKAKYSSLDVLMNNAGTAGDKTFGKTEDGYEATWQVNFYAPFLLTSLLMDTLAEGSTTEKPARVIMISSVTHTDSVNEIDPINPEGVNLATKKNPKSKKYWVYPNTKLADRMLTKHLHDKLEASELKGKVLSVCAHPGFSSTDMTMVMGSVMNTLFGQSASQGCLSQVRAAVDPTVQSGDFYGPNTATYLSVQHVLGLYKHVFDPNSELDPEPELYGDPYPSKLYSPHVQNSELCEALWQKAEEVTGETFNVSGR